MSMVALELSNTFGEFSVFGTYAMPGADFIFFQNF
jgi:hypothetical protein